MLLRPLTRLAVTLAFILLASAGALIALAETGPLAADSILFPLQQAAEASWLGLQPQPVARATYALRLLDRRTSNLLQAIGDPSEEAALGCANDALNQALSELAGLSPAEREGPINRLHGQVDRLLQAFSNLQTSPKKAEAFHTRLLSLRDLLLAGQPSTGALLALAGWQLNSLPPAGLQISTRFEHPISLSGRHAEIPCLQCHNTSAAPDSNACATCHETKRPTNHAKYLGIDCAACHTTTSWKGAKFSHVAGDVTQAAAMTLLSPAGTLHCATCHEGRRPVNHFTSVSLKGGDPLNGGDCSICHTQPGVSWKGVKFDHSLILQFASGAMQCASCHESKRPARHYSGDPLNGGDCATCHKNPGVTWTGAKFPHTDVTQCAACHESKRPARHYSGDCATCHKNPGVTWMGAKFPHTGVTQCAACHESRRPANHYSGDCATCHKNAGITWAGAKFPHSGLTQCASCHEKQRPAGHLSGDCSTCHKNPGVTWKGAVFNHAAAGATNCEGCHAARRPANHYSGQCSTCHNTSAWKPANFKHTFPMTHGGANSQCSKCHATSSGGAVNCFNCHNQSNLAKKHAEEKITFPADCMKCHADGRKP